MRTRRLATALLAVSIGCAAASAQHDNLPSTPESIRVVDLIGDYQADRRAIAGFYGMSFDPSALDRRAAMHERAMNDLRGVDFAALDQEGKIDYLALRTSLEADMAENDLSRARLDEMSPLIPFASLVAGLERERVAMSEVRYREVASALDGLDEMIDGLRARIDAGRKGGESELDPLEVSPVVANRTAGTVRQIRRTLDHWYEHRAGFEPEFAWWMEKPHDSASEALQEYANYLTRTVAGLKGEPDDPMIGDPIGREKLLADLAAEWIVLTPEELIEIAEREFAWCEAEYVRAAQEMGHGDDWRAALEEVKQRHVPPGEQDDLVAFLAQEAIDYVTDNDMVTVPELCRELWTLEMIPARDQRFWPFAFYGGNHMGVAYPTPEMSHEDKLMSMRGNNRHFTRAIVHHELIPGHHLQGFMSQRERSYRRPFATPFLGEGWCLYWEMILYDSGFPQSPEDRIGMLFWRMHRCARIIVSLKFHLGEMSPEEMVDFLVDRVGHERFGASSEVRRYIGGQYSPLYQCAYMVGGLQIRAMREELVESGQMTERQFHDEILLRGSIPIELIRAGLNNETLRADSRPAWRFGAN